MYLTPSFLNLLLLVKLFLILILSVVGLGFAQDNAYTGAISGQILDVESKAPLAYATVKVLKDTTVIGGAYTDEAGRFVVEGIPLGRVTLVVGYLGYEPAVRQNLLVTSGKDLILEIEMQESLLQTEAVQIKGVADKGQALNTMSTVSARTMSMEEANRYAGSLSDPSRMAQNFAGVQSGEDSRNDIIVRGNAPTAVLWRLEGVDIPSPNHFGSQGANGGPVSMLNNNTLANSDFFTGAFPAEYSNANAAAFDLRLRNGNTRKRESMFQLGFNGVELMSEGPFSKSGNSSYLASYRYSTLAAFDAIGIQWPGVLGIPFYQDFSFKLNFNKTPIGRISAFGVIGASSIANLESDLDKSEFESEEDLDYQDNYSYARMGVVGIQDVLFLDDKSFLQTTVAFSQQNRRNTEDSLNLNQDAFFTGREEATENKATLAMVYNRKINTRHSIRGGFLLDHIMVDYLDSTYLQDTRTWYVNRDVNDQTQLIRPYVQWQWRLGEKWTVNTGVNAMMLTLDNQTAIEPRAGLRYQLTPKSSLSAAYGMHHQMQPLQMYYFENAEGVATNKDLDFTRSQHYVLGYDWTPLSNFRVKLEGYYQYLDQIPVDPTSSSFSMVNFGLNFDDLPRTDNLVNNGTGSNYGLELTLEKFLSKGYYFLITGSFYNSEYTPSDGKTYSTAYNNNYVINALTGVERPVGKKKVNTVFADLRISTAGGRRYTPLDLEVSRAQKTTVLQDDKAYTKQARAYFRPDIKVGYRLNGRKISHEFGLQVLNFTGTENIQDLSFNKRTLNRVELLQVGFFPVIQYKVNF